MPFPDPLLHEAAWDFEGQSTFETRQDFEAAVEKYMRALGDDEPPGAPRWSPEHLALQSTRLLLEYFADPEGARSSWQRVWIDSDSPDGFEAGELLFKIHNAVVALLTSAGHHWFEGLELKSVSPDGVPTYSLIGGS